MNSKATQSELPARPSVRPYYVPAQIDFDALPEPVRVAFQAVIEPSFRELVVEVEGSLARSAGITLTFLLSLEVLDQFQLGQQLNYTADPTADGGERDRLIGRYLRLVGAKQQAERFLLRIHDLRARHDAATGVWRKS
jgi:hypothetical protein